METQYQRILKLHENRAFVCQAEYRNISWCPHKRRKDIEEGRAKGIPAGKYHFESKDCEHGIKGSRDYLLVCSVVEEDVKEIKDGYGNWIGMETVKQITKEVMEEMYPEQSEKLNL